MKLFTYSFLFLGALGISFMLTQGGDQHILSADLQRPEIPSQKLEKDSTYEYERRLSEFGLADRMAHHRVPGVSLAFIRDGQLDWAKGYGVLQEGKSSKVNTETVFSVGSVSKVGAAIITLKMYQNNVIDIDRNVNDYLRSWKIEDNRYTQDQPVTLRHIMSHTAGLTVHGFADFLPQERLPTTVDILSGTGPAKNNEVTVNIPVGSQYRYSGGGTTVEQLMVEDLTKKSFHEAASDMLFGPMGMTRSSYENPLPQSHANIAKAHDRNGYAVALPRGYQSMPEAAASGLWTTPSDLAKLMIMLMNAYAGKDTSYLSSPVVRDMMTPVAPSDYGLGPRMRRDGDHLLFSHGGANDSYRAHFIGNMHNQNGLVVLTNGTNGSTLINEIRPAFEDFLKKE